MTQEAGWFGDYVSRWIHDCMAIMESQPRRTIADHPKLQEAVETKNLGHQLAESVLFWEIHHDDSALKSEFYERVIRMRSDFPEFTSRPYAAGLLWLGIIQALLDHGRANSNVVTRELIEMERAREYLRGYNDCANDVKLMWPLGGSKPV
jgi:hypothetical protein